MNADPPQPAAPPHAPEPAPAPAVRIGAVNYLNSKPLVFELAGDQAASKLLFDLPSRLADSLAAGRLDVALIPVVEYFANPDYEVVSDACVASDGPVRSVKVYFRRPPSEVRRLALDEGSRTSAALARVLLSLRFGLTPEVQPLPIGSDTRAVDADAVLLIGDRAMLPPAERFGSEWDLATEWRRETGLPFVAALWAAAPGIETSRIDAALTRARDRGVAHLDRIAESEAPKLDLPVSLAKEYLRENLHFRLTEREQRSLDRFRHECERLGLIRAAAASPTE